MFPSFQLLFSFLLLILERGKEGEREGRERDMDELPYALTQNHDPLARRTSLTIWLTGWSLTNWATRARTLLSILWGIFSSGISAYMVYPANSDTWYNMEEPWGRYFKWNKLATKEEINYDSTHEVLKNSENGNSVMYGAEVGLQFFVWKTIQE